MKLNQLSFLFLNLLSGRAIFSILICDDRSIKYFSQKKMKIWNVNNLKKSNHSKNFEMGFYENCTLPFRVVVRRASLTALPMARRSTLLIFLSWKWSKNDNRCANKNVSETLHQVTSSYPGPALWKIGSVYYTLSFASFCHRMFYLILKLWSQWLVIGVCSSEMNTFYMKYICYCKKQDLKISRFQ